MPQNNSQKQNDIGGWETGMGMKTTYCQMSKKRIFPHQNQLSLLTKTNV